MARGEKPTLDSRGKVWAVILQTRRPKARYSNQTNETFGMTTQIQATNVGYIRPTYSAGNGREKKFLKHGT